MSQPEPDLSDMDDFEVIEERRRLQTALAFLTGKYKALNQEMNPKGDASMDGGTVNGDRAYMDAVAVETARRGSRISG